MYEQLRLGALKVTHLTGVGVKLAERLQKCGIRTVQDLLFHLPFRYQDRSHITPILQTQQDEWAVCEGVIDKIETRPGPKKAWNYRLVDASGVMMLCYFNFTPAAQTQLAIGSKVRCFGQVRITSFGKQMVHPDCQIGDEAINQPIEQLLTPIYSTTANLSQKQLRKLTLQALKLLEEKGRLDDLLPPEFLPSSQLPDLKSALHFLHHPPVDANIPQLLAGQHPAQHRLVFEELLAHQFALLRVRQDQQSLNAPIFVDNLQWVNQFLQSLPFKPTRAQQRVIDEILTDLNQDKPMLRLVQGDVGSGKTVVAAAACLAAMSCGKQAVLMAPTEILAEQHYQTLKKWFTPFGIETAWLTGKLASKERQTMLNAIASGSSLCAVGTHALFQDDVHFHDLGLVVIDEQHRFGVHQRLALRNKGVDGQCVPHQLIMTATPIPRTLTMTAYANLDCSIIDELPPGRTPVTTVVLSNSKRMEIIQRIKTHTEQHRQCYWVCPVIEESELLQCQAAEEAFALLLASLPNIKIALLHGRMKPLEKEAIMQRFKAAEIDVLVATTVIEVGVDVPNATLMVIENAERLGLSQLHQLRGRVGRGSHESFCVLMYQAPLSFHGRIRLNLMRETTDGFLIAEKDLEIRGPGEILGTKQTGLARLRIADLLRDGDLVEKAQIAARKLYQQNHPCIEPLVLRWLANQEEFSNV